MPNVTKVVLSSYGGADALELVNETIGAPEAGQVRLEQTAIGINFIDIMQRKGAGSLPLPTGLGFETAGVIDALGPDVGDFAPGDRVAYMNAGPGSYASARNVPAANLVRIPDDISDNQAAALLFKGLTAQYLVRRTAELGPQHRILIHAAAGGVGLIVTRWATALGAEVYGTASSDEKCKIALHAGCREVFNYSNDGWVDRALKIFGEHKPDVVYDSVGAHTFMGSLDLARPFGLVVVFGGASGPAPEIAPELLNQKGCLFLTRPSVFPHNADPARRAENAADLFAAIRAGHVQADIGATYDLEDVANAHRAIEARETSGAVILKPRGK